MSTAAAATAAPASLKEAGLALVEGGAEAGEGLVLVGRLEVGVAPRTWQEVGLDEHAGEVVKVFRDMETAPSAPASAATAAAARSSPTANAAGDMVVAGVGVVRTTL